MVLAQRHFALGGSYDWYWLYIRPERNSSARSVQFDTPNDMARDRLTACGAQTQP